MPLNPDRELSIHTRESGLVPVTVPEMFSITTREVKGNIVPTLQLLQKKSEIIDQLKPLTEAERQTFFNSSIQTLAEYSAMPCFKKKVVADNFARLASLDDTTNKSRIETALEIIPDEKYDKFLKIISVNQKVKFDSLPDLDTCDVETLAKYIRVAANNAHHNYDFQHRFDYQENPETSHTDSESLNTLFERFEVIMEIMIKRENNPFEVKGVIGKTIKLLFPQKGTVMIPNYVVEVIEEMCKVEGTYCYTEQFADILERERHIEPFDKMVETDPTEDYN
jgi:hypothetical protein